MAALALATQLRFARSEFVRCLEGVSDEEACKRPLPMNCLSWIVGHLANQENAYWVLVPTGKVLAPGLNDLVGYGKPASTPPLEDMWAVWREVTAAADQYLDQLALDQLTEHLLWKGKPRPESIGSMLQRNIYHYWYHTGEASSVRQMLGHANLPDFVGDMRAALYRPEAE